MPDRIELADEITEFLDRHSIPAASYDPEYDEPGERFNGPDSSMLFQAAECLRADVDFSCPLSSYGSGCYRPVNDREAEAWHDSLMARIKEHLAARSLSPK